jgi:hypothetical protein
MSFMASILWVVSALIEEGFVADLHAHLATFQTKAGFFMANNCFTLK